MHSNRRRWTMTDKTVARNHVCGMACLESCARLQTHRRALTCSEPSPLVPCISTCLLSNAKVGICTTSLLLESTEKILRSV